MKPIQKLFNPFMAAIAPHSVFIVAVVLLSGAPRLNAAGNYTGATQQGSGSTWDTTSYWNGPAPFGGQSATAIAAGDPGATFEMLIGSRLRSPGGTLNT